MLNVVKYYLFIFFIVILVSCKPKTERLIIDCYETNLNFSETSDSIAQKDIWIKLANGFEQELVKQNCLSKINKESYSDLVIDIFDNDLNFNTYNYYSENVFFCDLALSGNLNICSGCFRHIVDSLNDMSSLKPLSESLRLIQDQGDINKANMLNMINSIIDDDFMNIFYRFPLIVFINYLITRNYDDFMIENKNESDEKLNY